MLNALTKLEGSLLADRAGPSAPWLVLVHGVSQDHRIFDRQVEHFIDRYRLLLIDLPGHGVSSALPGPYGLSEFSGHVRSTIEHAGAGPVHLFGTHLGASACLLLACRGFGRIQSLILESPVFPGRPIASVASILRSVSMIAHEKGMNAARDFWWENGPWFDRIRAAPSRCRAVEHRRIVDDFSGAPWLQDGLIAGPLEPIEGPLARLEIPVAIINGQHESPDFVAASDSLAEMLGTVSRYRIPDAGGFPLWEYPERVNPVVGRFLGGV